MNSLSSQVLSGKPSSDWTEPDLGTELSTHCCIFPSSSSFLFSLLMSKGENRLSRMQLETSVKYPRLFHNLLRRLMDGSKAH